MIHKYPIHVLITVSVLLFALLTYLAATEPDRLVQAQQLQNGRNIEQGAMLYSLNCRTCHGLRGEGVGQLGPALGDAHFFEERLAEVGWQSTLEEYIIATTEHGRLMGTRPIYAGNGSTAVMSPWHQKFGGPLRSDEIRTIADFILNWEKTAEGSVVLVELELPKSHPQDPAVIRRGAAVFDLHCSRCHRYGNRAAHEIEGPDLTRILSVAGTRRADLEAADYLRESVLIPNAYIVDGYQALAAQNGCGAVLTESELTAVSGFLMH
ncbi:MAG: c-type cytochrome [Desulfofustis sp.]|nr:c-type cytochrome [Desulfofustis sp.]